MKNSDAKEDKAADMKQEKAMFEDALHKHETRLHKGKPLTKLAKGGMVKGRGDGIAIRGKTKCQIC